MKTTHQTIVLPSDPKEARKLLETLLDAPDTQQAWKEAHETHAGDDVVITEDDGHCGGCGTCSKCYPETKSQAKHNAKAEADALRRNRREDDAFKSTYWDADARLAHASGNCALCGQRLDGKPCGCNPLAVPSYRA